MSDDRNTIVTFIALMFILWGTISIVNTVDGRNKLDAKLDAICEAVACEVQE